MAISLTFIANAATKTPANPTVLTVPAGGVPAGSLIVVWYGHQADALTAVTDSASNTYNHPATLDSSGGGNLPGATMAYAFNCSALVSGNTISTSIAGTGVNCVSALYATGIQTSSDPFDAHGVASSVTGQTSSTVTSTGSTGATGELIIAFVALRTPNTATFTQDSTNQGGFSAGSIMPLFGTSGGSAATNTTLFGGYIAGWGSTGTVTYHPTAFSSSASWGSVIATFKAAPPPPPVILSYDPLFEPTRLKQPILDLSSWNIPGTSPPLTIPLRTREWYDIAKLKQPDINQGPTLYKPDINIIFNIDQLYEPIRLKQPVTGETGPWRYVSPPLTIPLRTREWYDIAKLKLPILDLNPQDGLITPPPPPAVVMSLTGFFDPIRLKAVFVDTPGTISFAQKFRFLPDPSFEQIKLKPPVIDNPPILFTPTVQVVVIPNFDLLFETVRLKAPIEVLTGPFAGTSPPLNIPLATWPWFEQVRAKPPIEMLIGPWKYVSPPLTIPLRTREWYDVVKLKSPIPGHVELPIIPAEEIELFMEQAFFEPVRLRVSVDWPPGPFAGTSPPLNIPLATWPWFDQTRLKPPLPGLVELPIIAAEEVEFFVEQALFEPVKLKLSVDWPPGPFKFVSPPLAIPMRTIPMFEPVKLKPPVEMLIGPFGGTSPPISYQPYPETFYEPTRLKRPLDILAGPLASDQPQPSGFIERYFETVRLRPQIIDYAPALFTPVAPTITGIIFATFFDTVRTKPPIEMLIGPFAGTSPPLTVPLRTREYFEPIRLRPQVIDYNPAFFLTAARTAIAMSFDLLYDPVKLKAPIEVLTGPFAGTSPPLTIPLSTRDYYEPIRLKLPIIQVPDNVPPFVTPAVFYSLSNFFDQVRLKLPIEVPTIVPFVGPLQGLVGAAFFEPVRPARIGVSFLEMPLPIASVRSAYAMDRYFDQVQRRAQASEALPFQFSAPAVTPTIQNALTEWYATTRLKQPIIDQPVVVFYPAQVVPSVTPPRNQPFINASMGRMFGR
jgi:hypothetical protein